MIDIWFMKYAKRQPWTARDEVNKHYKLNWNDLEGNQSWKNFEFFLLVRCSLWTQLTIDGFEFVSLLESVKRGNIWN